MTSGWNVGAEDDRRWDRLVDGSLSEREYRAMLAALDEQPDGWRRCALAFLEAQAWSGEMQQMRDGWSTGGETAQSELAADRGAGAATLAHLGLDRGAGADRFCGRLESPRTPAGDCAGAVRRR